MMQKSEADDQSWARGREQARASRPTTPESADRREVGICLGVRGATTVRGHGRYQHSATEKIHSFRENNHPYEPQYANQTHQRSQ